MIVLVFVLGSLLGMLAGGALVVHHLRAEIAANIGPTLERMQNQLDLIEGAVDIALAKWYEALRHYPPRPPELPPSGLDDDSRPLRLVDRGLFDLVVASTSRQRAPLHRPAHQPCPEARAVFSRALLQDQLLCRHRRRQPGALRLAIETYGIERVAAATDYPFYPMSLVRHRPGQCTTASCPPDLCQPPPAHVRGTPVERGRRSNPISHHRRRHAACPHHLRQLLQPVRAGRRAARGNVDDDRRQLLHVAVLVDSCIRRPNKPFGTFCPTSKPTLGTCTIFPRVVVPHRGPGQHAKRPPARPASEPRRVWAAVMKSVPQRVRVTGLAIPARRAVLRTIPPRRAGLAAARRGPCTPTHRHGRRWVG
jgi:hypothetical protein